jgi:hypothetical protein
MKTIFTTFLIITSLSVFSQGNLQFNRVYNFTQGTNYTVPAGKVLKIESVNFNAPTLTLTYASCYVNCPGCGSSSGVTCSYNAPSVFTIDQNTFYSTADNILYINSGGSCNVCPPTRQVSFNSSIVSLTMPIWLGEGKNLTINGNGVFISALEFNITQ